MSLTREDGTDLSFLLIFSDLDDTLLDHDTYSWEKAQPALDLCISSSVPVILVSSKTRAEIQTIHRAMGLDFPFISENGGGVFFPLKYKKFLSSEEYTVSDGFIKITLGAPYKSLVKDLEIIADETHLKLRGFSQMPEKEVMEHTDLNVEQCRLSLKREFDEPFIFEEPVSEDDIKSIYLSAQNKGLRISEGGRFFHLHGKSDKGTAVNSLIAFFKKQHKSVFSIALGDSPNDFGMFDAVNQPVLVKSKRRFTDINIKEKFPGILITDKNGPAGWNESVMGLLKTGKEVFF